MVRVDFGAFLAVVALGALLFVLMRRLRGELGLKVPSLREFGSYGGRKAHWVKLPRQLLLAALVFFSLAFVDLHWSESVQQFKPAAEGIALYLVVDRSRSMAEKAIGGGTKLDMLKAVAEKFVAMRPNDLIGLMAFARSAEVLAPLTLDHADVREQLASVTFTDDYTQDGTAIGYAIFKGANLMEVTLKQSEGGLYVIDSQVLVLVTDGLQNPNPADRENALRSMGLEEAATYAKSLGVKLYVINVDPRMTFADFAPHREQMERITALTGGALFLVDTPDALQKVFVEIDSLEKSPLPTKESILRRLSLAPFFIVVGMLALFASVTLGTTLLRRFP